MKIHQYNQMMKQLTDPGPSKKVQSYRKKVNEQPNATKEELINQVEKEFSEDKITTQQRPSALDTAAMNINKGMYIYDDVPASELIAQFNPVSGLYRNKAGTAAFKSEADAKRFNDYITQNTDNETSVKAGAASSKRKPGEAQKIAAFIKKEIRKKNPILKPSKPLNIDIKPVAPAAPVKPLTREDVIKEISDYAAKNKKDNKDMTGIFGSNEYFLRKKGI